MNEEEIKLYKQLLDDKGYSRDTEYAIPYHPEPKEKDYKNTFMFRYFARQANSPTAPIVEISKEQYNSWANIGSGLDNAFHIVLKIIWKIRGRLQSYTDAQGMYHKGIQEANNDTLELGEEKLPGIKSKLGNLLEFYQS
jgi:hypothetical protein